MHPKIPIISLFSGPGGMDLGFRQASFSVIFAADSDRASVETYNRNARAEIAHRLNLATITDKELLSLIESHTHGVNPRGLIGGPPCQAFSQANVRPTRNDSRKRLLSRYAQILATLNSRFDLDFFVFENVIGLKLRRNIGFFKRALRKFEKAGFNLFEAELNAVQFGLAQRRRRVFVVGLNSKRFPLLPFKFPVGGSGTKTVSDIIGQLGAPAFYSRGLKKKEIPEHVNHWTMQPRSKKFMAPSFSGGRSFRRLAWDEPSWTVAYGNREMHIHPSGYRRISVFEAMLLQGFPQNYRLYGTFSQQVTQVSNAVPPPLARAVAAAIRRSLYEVPVRIQTVLERWQKKHFRAFPWRGTRDVYKLLIAEKLLQQTAASVEVVKAYQTIVTKFPSIDALSTARLEELEEVVQALGLQYRAKELLRLARQIATKHKSKVPTTLKELLSLPGLGDYSARAILCFGRRERLPIVDTNIARFLIRFYALPLLTPTNPSRHSALRQLAANLVPDKQPDKFNFALLDLCASVCTPKSPRCVSCPLRLECAFPSAAKNESASLNAA